jgi:hypothetical protein
MALPKKQHHLLGVWNPSYESDAMDAHVDILLRNAREFKAGTRDDSDVYVWWGKVRSANRQQPLPHLDEVLALDEELGAVDGDVETRLYLTDYRSLFVAHLAAVTDEDMSGEVGFVPDYYSRKGLSCDCWFQLWDIRRLVLDDTPAVVAELAKLRNVRYHDRPVSIYGGMVELPLIVTSDDDARYFDETVRNSLTDGRYWVEFDAERSGAGAMQRDLRENRFGNEAWSALAPVARIFIATAEQDFRQHRADAAFDLSVVLVNLAKAVEVQTNAILRRAVASAPDTLRRYTVEGNQIYLGDESSLTLGQLARVVGGERQLGDFLRTKLSHGAWFTGQLPAILETLARARNPAAHGELVDRDHIMQLRNQLIGVGYKGDLLDLAQVRVK